MFHRSISMKEAFRRWLREESGVTAIEYSLIAGLVGVAIITGAGKLGSALSVAFVGFAALFATPA